MKKQVKKVTKQKLANWKKVNEQQFEIEDVKNRGLSNTCRIDIIEDALKSQHQRLSKLEEKSQMVNSVTWWINSGCPTNFYQEPKPSLWSRFKKWLKR